MAGREHWGVRAGATVTKPDPSSFTTTPDPRPPDAQPRAPACRRDTEVPAARRAQSQCGQAKSPRPRAPGRTHRAGQKPLGLALGDHGQKRCGTCSHSPFKLRSCRGTVRGHTADTHPGRDAPPGKPKGCIGSSSRRFLVFLFPDVAVADSWEKEKGKKKKKVPGSSGWKVSAKPPPDAAVPPKSSPSPDKAAAAARASCTNSQRMLSRWLPGWVLVGVSCPSHPEWHPKEILHLYKIECQRD